MDHQPFDVQTLFSKYTFGTASQNEVQEFLTLLATGDHDKEALAFMEAQIAAGEPQENLDVDRWGNTLDKIQKRSTIPHRRFRLWPRIAVAAVVAIAFSVWFYTTEIASVPGNEVSYINDIKPGKNAATLTLANGVVIQLNGQKTGVVVGPDLTYNDGAELTSVPSNDHFLTASTPRGGTYQVALPDGTRVWLNAASSLKFPSGFEHASQRKVILEGEAYFEVAEDKRHPFIVESKGQQVEVLGTHFNISAYDDDPSIRTTLVEGSVVIRIDGVANMLKPNQQAVVNAGNIQVSNVDAKYAIAWKNNNFVFSNERIETVMKMVERWYDVDVVYQGTMPQDRFRGSVSRFDNVSRVLSILEATGLVHFKIKDRTIYVSD